MNDQGSRSLKLAAKHPVNPSTNWHLSGVVKTITAMASAEANSTKCLLRRTGLILLIGIVQICAIPVSKYGKCHDLEKNLESREELANAVFTGTVRDVVPDYQHPSMFKGEVEIKRVFKGGNVIRTAPHVHHKRRVMVDGLGDPHICHSMVRKHDSRIFMVNANGHGDLRLNSSLVRITLNNLEHAESAVKGEFSLISLLSLAACYKIKGTCLQYNASVHLFSSVDGGKSYACKKISTNC